MGSHVEQTNPGQASAANAGATAQAQADAKLSNTLTSENQAQYNRMFGPQGSMNAFLDPNSLKVTGPTGTYGLQYNKATEQNATNFQNARGSFARTMANQGFGSAPAGFAADQQRQLAQGQASTQGGLFTDYATKSYQDALSNFWNANNLASGNAASALQGAVSSNQQAGGVYNSLYNTAGQGNVIQSPVGTIVGAGLQGAGTAVSGAMTCPAEDALILMFDGSYRKVQFLVSGDRLMGVDGQACELLELPIPNVRDCVECVSMNGLKTIVSADHTFMLEKGGYEFAAKSLHCSVLMIENTVSILERVTPKEKRPVYHLNIDNSHSYCCDGFWSLS